VPIDRLYPIDRDWLRHLHEAMGWQWPCPLSAQGQRLRADVMTMFAARGLPERYHNWCDGGEAFALAAWCLSAHLKPRTVVETGVARGVTSRLVLEALAQNDGGSLFSIDLLPLDSRYHAQAGIAVPEHLHANWTVLEGSSRHRLPTLLGELGRIDLFIHDSLHTGRNTSFELDHAWRRLRPAGALLVDDVYQSLAFHTFTDTVPLHWSSVGANPDGSYRFGIAIRP
jgi:hypothetical protein